LSKSELHPESGSGHPKAQDLVTIYENHQKIKKKRKVKGDYLSPGKLEEKKERTETCAKGALSSRPVIPLGSRFSPFWGGLRTGVCDRNRKKGGGISGREAGIVGGGGKAR